MSTLGFWISLGIGLAGLAFTTWTVATADNFLVLVAANSAVMLLTLGLHLWGLPNRTGSWMMCIGIVLAITASLLIPFDSQGIAGLGLYGTFHVALIPAVLFQYLGGRVLKRRVAELKPVRRARRMRPFRRLQAHQ